MCCKLKDLEPGAYLSDRTDHKLYEVRQTLNNIVQLVDAGLNIDDPTITRWVLTSALKRLDLVRAAPCADDIATAAEWGEAG